MRKLSLLFLLVATVAASNSTIFSCDSSNTPCASNKCLLTVNEGCVVSTCANEGQCNDVKECSGSDKETCCCGTPGCFAASGLSQCASQNDQKKPTTAAVSSAPKVQSTTVKTVPPTQKKATIAVTNAPKTAKPTTTSTTTTITTTTTTTTTTEAPTTTPSTTTSKVDEVVAHTEAAKPVPQEVSEEVEEHVVEKMATDKPIEKMAVEVLENIEAAATTETTEEEKVTEEASDPINPDEEVDATTVSEVEEHKATTPEEAEETAEATTEEVKDTTKLLHVPVEIEAEPSVDEQEPEETNEDAKEKDEANEPTEEEKQKATLESDEDSFMHPRARKLPAAIHASAAKSHTPAAETTTVQVTTSAVMNREVGAKATVPIPWWSAALLGLIVSSAVACVVAIYLKKKNERRAANANRRRVETKKTDKLVDPLLLEKGQEEQR